MKRRLSASIDDDLLAAAEAAVRDGQAPTMSALVEEALRLHVAKTRRLAAMDQVIAALDEERPMSTDEAERIMREWEAEAVRGDTGAHPPLSDAA